MAKRQIKKNPLEKRFREKLKSLMRKGRVKNREVAEYISRFRKPGEPVVTDAYISQLKSGERGVSLDRACIIANYFEVDPSEFFQIEPRRKELRIIYDDIPEETILKLRDSELEKIIVEKIRDCTKKELNTHDR